MRMAVVSAFAVATIAWAPRTDVPLGGMEPRLSASVVDPVPASEAHLRIGWAVFKHAVEWYRTKVAENKDWARF